MMPLLHRGPAVSQDAQDAQAGPATVPRTCFPWGLRDPISERPLVLAESTVRRATTSSYLSSCISKEGKLISAVASQHAARKTVESLQVKDHVCGVYNSDEDRWRDIKLFLKTGALNGEKLIYIVDAVTGSAAVRHFTRVFEENRLRKSPLPEYPPIGPGTRGTPGVVTGNSAEARRTSSDRTGDDDFVLNLQVLIDSKQLVFLHYEDAYTQYGKFEPERMVEFLDNCATTAKAEGWAGLRVVGEMSWTLRTFTTIDQLHYYEAIVNEVFRVREASAICHYDRRLFEAQDLINIISTHPTTSFGSNVYENIYYNPPINSMISSRGGAEMIFDHFSMHEDEKRKVEEALIRAKDEAQAESKSASMLLGTVSHDLRCPLIGIIGSIEMLRRSADKLWNDQSAGVSAEVCQDFEDTLRTIEACSEHLLSIANDILDYSRVRSTNFEPSEILLHTCLDDALRIFENKTMEKDIAVSVNFDESTRPAVVDPTFALPVGVSSETKRKSRFPRFFARGGRQKMILADEYSLRKILMNLMSNAVKYTNVGGHIRISISAEPRFSEPSVFPQEVLSAGPRPAQSPGSPSVVWPSPGVPGSSHGKPVRLTFKFQDDGIGISEPDIGRIFDAFQRVNNVCDSKGIAIEGTGLGLSIVQNLCKIMGGGIRVESSGPGKGSTFHLWFPTFLIERDSAAAVKGSFATEVAEDEGTMRNEPLGSMDPGTVFEGSPWADTHRRRLRFWPATGNTSQLDSAGGANLFTPPLSQTHVSGSGDEILLESNRRPKPLPSNWLPPEKQDSVGTSSKDAVSDRPRTPRQRCNSNSAGSVRCTPCFSTCGRLSSPATGTKRKLRAESSDSDARLESSVSDSPAGPATQSATWGRLKQSKWTNGTRENILRPRDVQSLKILVCDDNQLNCEILKKMLKSFGCSDISVCHDGQTAVRLVAGAASRAGREDPESDPSSPSAGQRADRPFDIILLDYRMPGELDGVNACKAIRRLSQPSRPIVVCVSAAALDGEESVCLSSGFDEFLIKPILRRTLGDLLDRSVGILTESRSVP